MSNKIQVKKVNMKKNDMSSVLAEQQEASALAADDRFKKAAQIIEEKPSGLSLAPQKTEAPRGNEVAKKIISLENFDLSLCKPGTIAEVPLSLIDLNEFGPRKIYTSQVVDRIANTMHQGQDDAAHGFVLNGRVQLIDGGTRYRAAKDCSLSSLTVKFEEPLDNGLKLFLRGQALNDNRNPTTHLDFALSLRKLLDEGQVKSQREIVEKIPASGGGKLSESSVSYYLRISRMPPKILKAMSNCDPDGKGGDTTSFVALYAISQLFPEGLTETDLEDRETLALQLIEEIKQKNLNTSQMDALVKSKIEGPKSRQRSIVSPIAAGRYKGQIKTFEKKGQIDLSLKGFTEEQLPLIKEALEATIKSFAEGVQS